MNEGDTTSDVDAVSEIPEEKTGISLYEFYVLGIERLLVKAPWELERSVSAYHESFLTEQRCLSLTILLLLGEEHMPSGIVQAAPEFEERARSSVNQAVLLRALKHYFESSKLNPVRAGMVLDRMQSYIGEAREAVKQEKDPLEAMFNTLVKRVPPRDEAQAEQYSTRVEKIYEYVSGLVEILFKRYEITK